MPLVSHVDLNCKPYVGSADIHSIAAKPELDQHQGFNACSACIAIASTVCTITTASLRKRKIMLSYLY